MNNKLKIKFGCLGITFIIVGVFIGIVLVMLRPDEMCGNHLIESKFSPNKEYKVLIFSRDCGASTGYSTHVSIIHTNEALGKNDTGNIFIADYNHGKAEMNGEVINLNIKWLDNEKLVLEYDKNAEIYKNNDTEKGIHIIYKEINETTNNGFTQ